MLRDKFGGWRVLDGELLRKLRKSKLPFLTEKKLGSLLHPSRSGTQIGRYEKEDVLPPLDAFKEMCLILQVSADELLGIEKEEKDV